MWAAAVDVTDVNVVLESLKKRALPSPYQWIKCDSLVLTAVERTWLNSLCLFVRSIIPCSDLIFSFSQSSFLSIIPIIFVIITFIIFSRGTLAKGNKRGENEPYWISSPKSDVKIIIQNWRISVLKPAFKHTHETWGVASDGPVALWGSWSTR